MFNRRFTNFYTMKLWHLVSVFSLSMVLCVTMVSAQEIDDDSVLPMADAIVMEQVDLTQANPLMREKMMNMMDSEKKFEKEGGCSYFQKYNKGSHYKNKSYGMMFLYKTIWALCALIFIFFAACVARKGWECGGHCCHKKGFFNKE